MNGWKGGLPWVWLFFVTTSLAEPFPNADYEFSKFDAWTVGGRKDAKAELIPLSPVLERLRNSRLFRNDRNWERHPFATLLERSNNKSILQVSSDGYLKATSETKIRIEAGKRYEVSLITLSRNGGEAIYYLDVFAIGKDLRFPLGTAQCKALSDELFRQTFAFSVEQDHPHIGKQIGLTARYRGRNLLDKPAIRITSINRSGADEIARHLPVVET
ncbi:MAG: hypothetical protein VX821_05995, partial [Verrucomicrobiota bacterium]|nr:hypothetical protein [Verrucomicrobiota bacterium]